MAIYMDAKHQFMYHVVLFISFVTAILIFPFIKTQVEGMVTNAVLQLALPYLVAYGLAIYLLPKLLSSIFMSLGNR